MLLKINASIVSIASVLLLAPLFASAQTITAPTLILTLNKASVVATANPSYSNLPIISWASTKATSCRASGTGWSGRASLSGNQKVNPLVTATYTMVCTGTGGSVTRSVTLTVTPSSAANLNSASVINGYDQLTQTGQTTNTSSVGTSAGGFKYSWNRNLQIGSLYTEDISALQTALTREGVYASEITGSFYGKTFEAIKKFQAKNAIESTGFVGPQTREKLNALYGN